MWRGSGSCCYPDSPVDQHTFSSVPVSTLPLAVGMSAGLEISRPEGLCRGSYPQAIHRQDEFSRDQFPQPTLPYYGYEFTYRSQEPRRAVEREGKQLLKARSSIQ
jgi:hypothetical protein